MRSPGWFPAFHPESTGNAMEADDKHPGDGDQAMKEVSVHGSAAKYSPFCKFLESFR